MNACAWEGARVCTGEYACVGIRVRMNVDVRAIDASMPFILMALDSRAYICANSPLYYLYPSRKRSFECRAYTHTHINIHTRAQ